ncbi:MAG TPA: phospholipase D-like domain-containing protein [Steroidobacteraceae bacterium]|nr:phospholipase D-like domain-containing protein [Steroidobacteraceae bacterium]
MPFTSTMRDVPATRRRVWRRVALLVCAAIWVGTALWQTNKPLPPGLHVNSPWYPVAARDVTFIADVTSADAYGRPIVSQAIFDEVLRAVHAARRFVVLDYYLFGGSARSDDQASMDPPPGVLPRQLSAELRDALIQQRRAQPGLRVLFITDPVSELYGDRPSSDLSALQAAGVEVSVTNLRRLRDPNFVYSSLWRLSIGWWSGTGRTGSNGVEGWLPNPLLESDAPVSFRAWTRLLNFKSNHRNVLLADDGHDDLVAIVGSASPHDASAAHSNVALKVVGPAMLPLLRSELAVARLSGWQGSLEPIEAIAAAAPTAGGPAPPFGNRAKVLTEGAIRAALIERLDACARGDSVDIAMFYVADRGIVQALLAASRRGATVRLILDPNKDAYGHARAGIPNQPVASELVASSDGAIHVRWYRTHGEQFHTKLAVVYGADRLWLMVGSANLTRRNLLDYDLEANVAIDLERNSPMALQVLDYFDTLWNNRAPLGIEYTADFGFYSDPSQLHYWLYRFLEGTGASVF